MTTKVCKQCGEKVAIGGDSEEGTHYYECPKCGPTDAVDYKNYLEQDYPCRVKIEFFCVFKGTTSGDAERKGSVVAEKMLKVLRYNATEGKMVRLDITHEPGASIDALPNKT